MGPKEPRAGVRALGASIWAVPRPPRWAGTPDDLMVYLPRGWKKGSGLRDNVLITATALGAKGNNLSLRPFR